VKYGHESLSFWHQRCRVFSLAERTVSRRETSKCALRGIPEKPKPENPQSIINTIDNIEPVRQEKSELKTEGVQTMTKAEEKLQKLEQKRKELEAKIQREKSRLSSAARKADTRRKVLVGAALITANTAGDPRVPDELLAQILDAYITDAKARAFLGLDAPASDDSGDTPAPLPADGGGQEMRPAAAEDTI
jgi:hypothetical protein